MVYGAAPEAEKNRPERGAHHSVATRSLDLARVAARDVCPALGKCPPAAIHPNETVVAGCRELRLEATRSLSWKPSCAGRLRPESRAPASSARVSATRMASPSDACGSFALNGVLFLPGSSMDATIFLQISTL